MWKKFLTLLHGILRTRIFWISLIVLVADQLTKFWVWKTNANVSVIGDFLRITTTQNPYGIFGLRYKIPILPITGLAICAIFIILYKSKLLPLSLILGGAIGNFIDRIRIGAVIDWIDIGVNNTRWYVFNIADASITIGILWLILKEIKRK
ncbi:signal peptidase II [candidate division WOR-3 bacterium]|nr:signal peptidase II [candidate division WOR-3 bacterium]